MQIDSSVERALKPRQIWAIRFFLDREGRMRDRALFDLAIDSKLRGVRPGEDQDRYACVRSGNTCPLNGGSRSRSLAHPQLRRVIFRRILFEPVEATKQGQPG